MPDETRNETMEALRADLAALEAGGEPVRFAAGHGLQSRVFRFEWDEPSLRIDLELPFARVLSDEETQAADAAELGAAVRMAILLLAAADGEALLSGGEARLSVSHDGTTPRWSAAGADGEILDEADDWSALAARRDSAFPGSAATVIWP